MADIVLQKSIGELVDTKSMSTSLSWTAGGASDSVTFTGTSIDREGFATGSLPRTADVAVAYDVTLGSGKTLSIQFDVQEGPDGSNWSDYASEASTVFATGPSGGGRVSGVARMAVASSNAPAGTPGVNLNSARRYTRAMIIPHFSATGTDTGVISIVGVFAGFDQLSAPQT